MDTNKNQAENNEIKAEELTSEAMEAAAGGEGYLAMLDDLLDFDIPGCIFGSHNFVFYSSVARVSDGSKYMKYRCAHCGLFEYYKCIGDKKIRISEAEYNS